MLRWLVIRSVDEGSRAMPRAIKLVTMVAAGVRSLPQEAKSEIVDYPPVSLQDRISRY